MSAKEVEEMADMTTTDCKRRIIDAWEHQVRKKSVDKITIKAVPHNRA